MIVTVARDADVAARTWDGVGTRVGGGGGTRARATTGRVRVGAAGRAGCRSSASWGGRVGECVVRGRWCAL